MTAPIDDTARALYESLECDNNHNERDLERITAALREAEAKGAEKACNYWEAFEEDDVLTTTQRIDKLRTQAAAIRAGG